MIADRIAACLLVCAGLQQAPADEVVLRWKGASVRESELAATAGASAAEAAALWKAWTREHGYALDLDPTARVLFAHPKSRSPSAELATIARVLEIADKFLPPAPPAQSGARALSILELENPADLASVLELLAKQFPYLASWAEGSKTQMGFVLEQPLAASWLAKPPDVKEWNPKNELANRLTQLALAERCGRQPNWLTQGLAWHTELTVCNAIYCFPFRAGFVARKEHRSWSDQLAALTAAHPTLTITDLTDWPRGTYANDRALFAWGAATFLAKKRADALPLLLADLQAVRDKEARITKPDGSWTVNPDYEIPAEKQEALLLQRVGATFFSDLHHFCAGN
jgi:hypothetical protein